MEAKRIQSKSAHNNCKMLSFFGWLCFTSFFTSVWLLLFYSFHKTHQRKKKRKKNDTRNLETDVWNTIYANTNRFKIACKNACTYKMQNNSQIWQLNCSFLRIKKIKYQIKSLKMTMCSASWYCVLCKVIKL